MNRLAECCGLSRKTIIERVKVLIDKGFLTKFHRYNDSSQQSNLYQIHLLPSVSDTPPSAGAEKKVVQLVHPPSAGDTYRTKTIEQKSQKENLIKFKETISSLFKK